MFTDFFKWQDRKMTKSLLWVAFTLKPFQEFNIPSSICLCLYLTSSFKYLHTGRAMERDKSWLRTVHFLSQPILETSGWLVAVSPYKHYLLWFYSDIKSVAQKYAGGRRLFICLAWLITYFNNVKKTEVWQNFSNAGLEYKYFDNY